MRHRLRSTGLILWLVSSAAIGHADTRQNFDTPAGGTAYAHTDARTDPAVTQPDPVEFADFAGCNAIGVRRLTEGGRSFLRLVHDSAPVTPAVNCNAVTFNCVERATPGVVTIDFDFRVTNPDGQLPADGFSVSLLRVAPDLAPGVPIEVDEVAAPGGVAEVPDIPGSLGFGFDFYEDPPQYPEHVRIHYDGAQVVPPVPIPLGQSLVGTGWIHAAIRVDFGQRLVDLLLTREDHGELLRIDHVAVPGLLPYASRVHLAGRAGGLTANIDIDELVVAFPAGDPAKVGSWSPVIPLASVPIHAAVLPGGKVLYWDRHDYGEGRPFLWDGVTSTPAAMPTIPGTSTMYDLFCAGHTFAADGSLFTAGGHIADNYGEPWASRFDPVTRQWTSLPAMRAGRWYPTTATLPSGDIVVVSGDINPFVGVNRIPEVFEARRGQWRALTGAERPVPFYPFLFTTRKGLFAAGSMPDTGFLDVTPPGRWIPVGRTIAAGRNYGSAVLTDAQRDQVLVIGGTQTTGSGDETLRSTESIDLSQTKASWQAGPPMSFARRMHVATLLPDGSVLVTGGTSGDAFNRADGAILNPELLTDLDHPWQPMACATEARIYHSVALLLPDARVLVAGGGHPAETENCAAPPCAALDHPSAEIFSPPYLHRGAQLAPPEILAGAGVEIGGDGIARVNYGASVLYRTPDPARVRAVTWLRPAAVTHAFNQDQRIVRPAAGPGGIGAQVIAPDDPAVAPPGPYMMFLLDDHGVPSRAAWVRTNLPPEAADDAFDIIENEEIASILDRILANDVDVEGDPMAIEIVAPPSHGQIVDGNYRPSSGFAGSDSFRYTVSDGLATSREAVVEIRIAAVASTGCDAGPAGARGFGALALLIAAAWRATWRRRARG